LKTGAALFGSSTLATQLPLPAVAAARFEARRIRLSLAAYSFRDQLRSKEMTMAAFIDYCDALRLDGTELTSYFFESEEDAYLLGLRNKCFHLGLPISGTAIGNDFVTPDAEKRRKQVADVKYWIDKAAVLGAPSIRVFGGGRIPDGHTEQNAYDWVIPAMQECVAYAAGKGIVLALENHGGFPTTSEQVIKIIQKVDSPWLGVNLDTGNFDSDWYRQMAELIPYSVVVQLKVNLHSTVAGGRPVTTDAERKAIAVIWFWNMKRTSRSRKSRNGSSTCRIWCRKLTGRRCRACFGVFLKLENAIC
jgi:sugar phosphate isomerase/epimerase